MQFKMIVIFEYYTHFDVKLTVFLQNVYYCLLSGTKTVLFICVIILLSGDSPSFSYTSIIYSI